MNKYVSILFFALGALVGTTYAQVPIPTRALGFHYGGRGYSTVQLDAFLDLMDPTSKIAFPTLVQVAEYYGLEDLRLNIIIFPAPYRRAAWLAARGTYILNEMVKGKGQSKMTYRWMAELFAVQEKFSNEQLVNKTDREIIGMLTDVASKLGVDRKVFFLRLEGTAAESITTTMFKFVCSRSIYGTSHFELNGVSADAAAGATYTWTLENWKAVIDSLL